ncbi:MAG TPA: NDP-sugar synthase [Vicinamibacterales bacterium]|nr:NDP-sugar synthase [Vicinamibacterales bacterium]
MAPALVLAAGFGTRFHPLSLARAKAAAPVAGVPLAGRILAWLGRHAIRDVVINLHHRPETVAAAVGDGADWGVRVRYSWEPRLLGTAGGPRHALPLLDAPRFFIVNGDTLTDLDPRVLLDRHRAAGALVTLALVPNPDPRRYGGVLVERGRVRGFLPPGDTAEGFHFIGVQVAESSVFEPLPDGRPLDSTGDLYRRLLAERPEAIAAHVCEAGFEDLGTPADYLRTCLAVARREGGGADVLIGAGCRIDPTARLERAVLWDGVSVGSQAVLVDCVVADDVEIAAGTRLERCAVARARGSAASDRVVVPL